VVASHQIFLACFTEFHIVYIFLSLSSKLLILSIFEVKSIFSSFLSLLFVTYHISRGFIQSVHCCRLLSFILTLNLIKANMNGINVISYCLKVAIRKVTKAIIQDGSIATSFHTDADNERKTL